MATIKAASPLFCMSGRQDEEDKKNTKNRIY
jgi:hypothetical protein